jgi:hypothetical protein
MDTDAKTTSATWIRRRLRDLIRSIQVPMEEFRQFRHYRREREQFFDWLDTAAVKSLEHNRQLGDDEVTAIIAEARRETASLAR